MQRALPYPFRFAAAVLLFLGAAASSGASAAQVAPQPFSRRYILVFANLGRAEDRTKVSEIARRAAAAGYNGLLLGSKAGEYIDLWNREPSAEYADAFARLGKELAALHMIFIPYALNASEVAYAAPELAEAIPCRDTPFVVQNGVATMAPTEKLLLENGDFDQFDDQAPKAWGCDKPGAITFRDAQVKHGGSASVRIENTAKGDPKNGHGRLWQTVSVTPFRAYEFSVWVKTEKLTDTHAMQFYFEGADGGQPLVYANREAGFGGGVAETQDWTRYTIRFNSASNSRLELYLGIWSPQSTGRLWIDDAEMHEIGLFHTVRRDSLPVKVAAATGDVVYEEGRDYRVADGKLEIPAGSQIKDDARLKVSWYQRAEMIGAPFANASHDKYFEVERGIAKHLDALFQHPPGFMMTYDEWRVANWDPAAGPITAGEYMAATEKKTEALLREINPKYELFVWSDMFDPNENAEKRYFMCNGPLTDSWKDLSKETTIMTWVGGVKALKFFSDLGLPQVIGGYYSSMENVKDWLDNLDAAEAQGAKGIDGFMYTTWDDNFADIEKVAQVITARGRWPTKQGGR